MELSILIPARNEEFLAKTIENILENIEADTEIIAVMDGYTTELPTHPRLRVLHNVESIGQRAATNQACRHSKAAWIMKVDAHCSFDKGFDRKMIADMQEDWVMAPLMRNLHAFDWKCEDGHTRYQGPSGPCQKCGKPTVKDMKWIGKPSPQSTSYCFDEEPHFQYFGAFKKRPEGKGDITESMSLQGSCFMVSRHKYWELNLCDEKLGSWGSQGIEVACKAWLSGCKVMINHKTWYAHMFRTQGGDFGFPYPQSGKKVGNAKRTVKELFFDNKWEKQIYPLSWLLERFWPVPGWSEESLKKLQAWPLIKEPEEGLKNPTVGIIYYTDNELEPGFMKKVQDQIKLGAGDKKIVSVSLKPTDFGQNIVMPLVRGKLTMFKQILKALETLDTDIVYFCEHDVMYHPSHFDFIPPKRNVYYYNMNLWRVRQSDGFAIRYDHKALSEMCVYRKRAIEEYKERVRKTEEMGYHKNGYEPGTRSLRRDGYSNDKAEGRLSEYPNIDVRHNRNLSASYWTKDFFRDKRSCSNWKESTLDKIDGWDNLNIK